MLRELFTRSICALFLSYKKTPAWVFRIENWPQVGQRPLQGNGRVAVPRLVDALLWKYDTSFS